MNKPHKPKTSIIISILFLLILPLVSQAEMGPFGVEIIDGKVVSSTNPPIVIPSGKDVPTYVKFKESLFVYYYELISETYNTLGSQGVWDNDLSVYFKVWSKKLASTKHNLPFEERLKLAQKIAQSGCDDALFLYFYGDDLYRDSKTQKGFNALRKSYTIMTQENYPEALLVRLLISLRSKASYLSSQRTAPNNKLKARDKLLEEEKPDMKKLHRLNLKSFHPYTLDLHYFWLKMLKNIEIDSKNQRIFYALFFSPNAKGKITYFKKDFEKAILKLPNRVKWLRELLLGKLYIDMAWTERGHGWAYTVSSKSWKGFAKYLSKANKHLLNAYKANPKWPEAASLLIQIAMGKGQRSKKTIHYWFNQAVKAEMDYPAAYKYYKWAIRPRWGGSYKQMYELALAAVQTNRYDTLIPYQFYNITYDIKYDSRSSTNPVYKQKSIFKKLKRMISNYKRIPGFFDPSYVYTRLLITAVRSELWDESAEILELLDRRYFGVNKQINYAKINTISEKIKAYKFVDRALLKQAERYLKNRQIDEGVLILDKLAENPKNNESLKSYLKKLKAPFAAFKDFHSGKKTQLLFNSELSSWKRIEGSWLYLNKNSVKGTSSDDGLVLLSRLDLGKRFEFEVSVKQRKGIIEVKNGGLIMNQKPNYSHSGGNFQIFTAYHMMKEVWFFDYDQIWNDSFYDPPGDVLDRRVGNTTTLKVIAWDHTFYYYFNNELIKVFKMHQNDRQNNYKCGIGGKYFRSNSTIIEFSNISVRKLQKKPVDSQISAYYKFKKINKLIQKNAFTRAKKIFASFNLNEAPKALKLKIHRKRLDLEMQILLSKGDWVDIPLKNNELKYWQWTKGNWTYKDGVLDAKAWICTNHCISPYRMKNFEIRGEMENYLSKRGANVSFFFGYGNGHREFQILWNREYKNWTLSRRRNLAIVQSLPTKKETKGFKKFHISQNNGILKLWIDKKEVLKSNLFYIPEGFIGFSGLFGAPGARMRFRNLQLKIPQKTKNKR